MAVARWYRSKVDRWILVMLCLGPLVTLSALVGTAIAGSAGGVAISGGGVALFVAIYAGLVWPMEYGIDEEHLVVRHGLVRQRIALRDIREVTPTSNPLSSPALSLDRLAVRFGDGMFKNAMISPVQREEFLAELATRAELRRDGERLVRD